MRSSTWLAVGFALVAGVGCGKSANHGGGGGAPPRDGATGESGGANGGSGGAAGSGGTKTGGVGGSRDAGSTADAAATSDASAGRMQAVYLTFYGWPDNSPPGNAIAYPKSDGFSTVHDGAGGTGTYADPITFASDKAEFPVGTLLFAPVLKKYLVMEDDCAECDTDWTGAQKWHIDVWMNSNATDDGNAVLACEDRWTQTTTTVEVNPPPGRDATTPPLFDTGTNQCRTTP
jgi:hypothetical protein